MIFTTYQRKRYIQESLRNDISLQENHIKNVKTTKFLGILIHENLCWDPFFDQQATKANKGICVLNFLKYILPTKCLIQIYYSIILPHLQYGVLAWGEYLNDISKLEIVQKKAIRIINKSTYNEHTDHLFAKFKILRLKDIYKTQVANFIFKFKESNLPEYFENFIDRNKILSENNTNQLVGIRNDHTYNLPIYDELFIPSELRKKTLKIACYNIWEKLPINLINFNGPFQTFKKKLKLHFLESYPSQKICFVRNCFSCDRYTDPDYIESDNTQNFNPNAIIIPYYDPKVLQITI